MAPLAVVSCMLPYFPTSPGVILWLYGAVQVGLGWASLQMQIRKSAKTAECGHTVLAVVMTWIPGHADISNKEFISRIIKEFIA